MSILKNDFSEHIKELGWTPLHCTVEKQEISLVQELLTEGCNINSPDNYNRTPLSIAASKGNLPLIELLLAKGANINEGFPLHYACEKGHISTVRHLLEKGASVNLEKDQNYPLLIASSKGNIEITKILIENGADINLVDTNQDTALHLACDNGNFDLISFLISSGCSLNTLDKYGLTPLSICLIRQEDKPELVKLLLEKGTSVNLLDSDNSTYLHSSENPQSTLELIKHGVNINSQNTYQETPLYHATFYNHLDCGEILLENKADPNIPIKDGSTALHVAVAEGHLEYVEELLNWKADVNARTAQNVTPLHMAAFGGHLEIVKLLLERGALVNIPTTDIPCINSDLPGQKGLVGDGLTPLNFAEINEHLEICKLLEERKDSTPSNDADIFSGIGWTPLHISVAQSSYDATSTLINQGISTNTFDKFQRTPLSIAAAKNDIKILTLLLDNGADMTLGFPLHYAVEKDSLECVQELLRRNCDTEICDNTESKSTPLHKATSGSKFNIMKLLLEHNANPNCINHWKETPLHISCRLNDFETTRLLITHGADINAVDNLKETPLLHASDSGNVELMKLLLDNGADVKAKNRNEWTCLHNAASLDPSCVTELIKRGATVDAPNDEGETPLFIAVSNPPVTKILIEHNSDVNYRTPGGWTPLFENVHEGSLETVKILLDNKSNVNSASAEFVLPIYLAAISGSLPVTEELLNRGSYIDPQILDIGVVRDDSGNYPLSERYHIIPGNTPLIGAASKGHLEVVKFLHSRGASLNLVNCRGNTALHEAILNCCDEVVKFLMTVEIDKNIRNLNGKTALDLLDVTEE